MSLEATKMELYYQKAFKASVKAAIGMGDFTKLEHVAIELDWSIDRLKNLMSNRTSMSVGEWYQVLDLFEERSKIAYKFLVEHAVNKLLRIDGERMYLM